MDNRRITSKEVTDDVCISFGLCQAIFTDVLGMKRAAVKIVSKLLNLEQKQQRMDIAQKMLTKFKNDPDLLRKVITSDELCVYSSDIETKAESSKFKTFCYE